MTLSTQLHRYANYNLWANQRFAEWLKTLPGDWLHREIVSSFPSIRKTLEHYFWAEWLWLQRLQGNSLGKVSLDLSEVSDAVFFEKMLQNSADLRDEILRHDDARLNEICDYRFLNGTETSSVRADMILHFLQHSTFHRGQIVTMARQLGVEKVPATDFIVFSRESPVA